MKASVIVIKLYKCMLGSCNSFHPKPYWLNQKMT